MYRACPFCDSAVNMQTRFVSLATVGRAKEDMALVVAVVVVVVGSTLNVHSPQPRRFRSRARPV